MGRFLPGILFAMLWASASAATKIGIQNADPLLLANIRFLLAGSLMLIYAYLIRFGKNALPRGKEWQQLLIFALLNTTIYLGAFVVALKEVSAGIGSLATATNPLFIMVMSAVWLRRKLKLSEISGVILGLAGVLLATYPLLQDSHATWRGLLILLGGMVSVSAATVYYARIKWELSAIVVNGWQVLIGGFCLLPFTLFFADIPGSQFDASFWGGILWLIFPVSILALQLWFYLVKEDAVRASIWLFLCPIFRIYLCRNIIERTDYYLHVCRHRFSFSRFISGPTREIQESNFINRNIELCKAFTRFQEF